MRFCLLFPVEKHKPAEPVGHPGIIMTRKNLTTMAACALVLTGLTGAAIAGSPEWKKPLGVVELFTSQGCSSCPPADALFAEMVSRGDLVALAYHVDYWDYLGWRDTMARPENTERQRDYGRSFGVRSVYTPQAVINGRVHVNGAKKVAITGTLETLANSGKGMSVDIKTKRDGEGIVIETGAGPTDSKAHLVIVYYDAAKPVAIDRGENGGSMVTYWNAVTDVQTAGMWHGEPARFELPMSELNKKQGCAALLQSVSKDGLPGPILGAAILQSPEAPWTK
jgi:hypothetical protein